MIDYHGIEKQQVVFTDELLADMAKNLHSLQTSTLWLEGEAPNGTLEIVIVRSGIGEVSPYIHFLESEEEWLSAYAGFFLKAGFDKSQVEGMVKVWGALDKDVPQRSAWCYADQIPDTSACLVGYLAKGLTVLFTLTDKV